MVEITLLDLGGIVFARGQLVTDNILCAALRVIDSMPRGMCSMHADHVAWPYHRGAVCSCEACCDESRSTAAAARKATAGGALLRGGMAGD